MAEFLYLMPAKSQVLAFYPNSSLLHREMNGRETERGGNSCTVFTIEEQSLTVIYEVQWTSADKAGEDCSALITCGSRHRKQLNLVTDGS